VTGRDQTFILVLVTTKTAKEAKKLGKLLVDAKLAACCTVISEVQSIYRWKKQVMSERESMVLVKSRLSRYKELERRIKAHHSYETPEIIGFAVRRGSQDYLNWITQETR
jgi:periplasmic divalent cation tolerance protein